MISLTSAEQTIARFPLSIDLITTKIMPPRIRSALLPRLHLINQLNVVSHAALTLLSAPAGFGKTTLLCDWIARQEIPTGWVTLDAGDADPTIFWRYVIRALQTVSPAIGADALSQLYAPQPVAFKSILTTLINDISDCLYDLVLVLDDYHLADSTVVREALIFLIDHLPPQLHLVIATRVEPPFPLARLRARGQLIELRADDLRLTVDEAATLLHDILPLPLPAAAVMALAARSEGWITGLHLAALALREEPNATRFISTFRGSFPAIADYLIDEVLVHQPDHIQTFLLQTALLERINASLCAAVTGYDDSQNLLAQLAQSNLFLMPLDDEGCWYRYHQFFAEALAARLLQKQPEEARAVHQRAYKWYIAHNILANALPHALAANDDLQAADLLSQLAEQLLLRGEITTFLSWMRALPEKVVRDRPTLCIARAFALMSAGQTVAVNADLQTLTASLNDMPVASVPPDAGIEAIVDADKHFNSRQPTWMLDSITTIRLLTATLQDASPRTLRDLYMTLGVSTGPMHGEHHTTALMQGFAHWAQGVVTPARDAFTQALRTSQQIGDHYGEVLAICFLAEISMNEGYLRHAARLYEQASHLLEHLGDSSAPIACVPAIGLGSVYFEWGDLDRAQQLVDQGLELAIQGGRADVVLTGQILRARIEQASGEPIAACLTIEKAVSDVQTTSTSRFIAYAQAHRAALWLAQNDNVAALRWAHTQSMSIDDEISFLREWEYLTFARVLLIQGAHDAALHLLARLQTYAVAAGRRGQAITTLIITALTHQARNDATNASDALIQALILAEPGGYLRSFIEMGAPLKALLMAVQRAKKDRAANLYIPWAYLDRLLLMWSADRSMVALLPPDVLEPTHPTAVPLSSELPRVAGGQSALPQAKGAVVAPPQSILSAREMDVLRCLAAGMSTEEIAQRLILSPGTVKWHLGNLYRKLDVGSRTQALAQARQMSLLA